MSNMIPADITIIYKCASCGLHCLDGAVFSAEGDAFCASCVSYLQRCVDAYETQCAERAEERANRQSDTRQLARAAKCVQHANNDIREMKCNGFRRTHTRANTRQAKRDSSKAMRRLGRAIIAEQA